jgi:hypothetical protein
MGVVGEWHASHTQLGWRGVEHSVSMTGRERTVKAPRSEEGGNGRRHFLLVEMAKVARHFASTETTSG